MYAAKCVSYRLYEMWMYRCIYSLLFVSFTVMFYMCAMDVLKCVSVSTLDGELSVLCLILCH